MYDFPGMSALLGVAIWYLQTDMGLYKRVKWEGSCDQEGQDE